MSWLRVVVVRLMSCVFSPRGAYSGVVHPPRVARCPLLLLLVVARDRVSPPGCSFLIVWTLSASGGEQRLARQRRATQPRAMRNKLGEDIRARVHIIWNALLGVLLALARSVSGDAALRAHVGFPLISVVRKKVLDPNTRSRSDCAAVTRGG